MNGRFERRIQKSILFSAALIVLLVVNTTAVPEYYLAIGPSDLPIIRYTITLPQSDIIPIAQSGFYLNVPADVSDSSLKTLIKIDNHFRYPLQLRFDLNDTRGLSNVRSFSLRLIRNNTADWTDLHISDQVEISNGTTTLSRGNTYHLESFDYVFVSFRREMFRNDLPVWLTFKLTIRSQITETLEYDSAPFIYVYFTEKSNPYLTVSSFHFYNASLLVVRFELVNPLNVSLHVKEVDITLFNWTNPNGEFVSNLWHSVYYDLGNASARSFATMDLPVPIEKYTDGFLTVRAIWNSTETTITVHISLANETVVTVDG